MHTCNASRSCVQRPFRVNERDLYFVRVRQRKFGLIYIHKLRELAFLSASVIIASMTLETNTKKKQ